MAAQKRKESKKVSIRRCLICRGRAPKRELIRVAVDLTGVHIDAGCRTQSRGAYVHKTDSCLSRFAPRKQLEYVLRLSPGSVGDDEVSRCRRELAKLGLLDV